MESVDAPAKHEPTELSTPWSLPQVTMCELLHEIIIAVLKQAWRRETCESPKSAGCRSGNSQPSRHTCLPASRDDTPLTLLHLGPAGQVPVRKSGAPGTKGDVGGKRRTRVSIRGLSARAGPSTPQVSSK